MHEGLPKFVSNFKIAVILLFGEKHFNDLKVLVEKSFSNKRKYISMKIYKAISIVKYSRFTGSHLRCKLKVLYKVEVKIIQFYSQDHFYFSDCWKTFK